MVVASPYTLIRAVLRAYWEGKKMLVVCFYSVIGIRYSVMTE